MLGHDSKDWTMGTRDVGTGELGDKRDRADLGGDRRDMIARKRYPEKTVGWYSQERKQGTGWPEHDSQDRGNGDG